MAPVTWLVDAGFLLLTASLYAYVGRMTLRRRVAGDGQLAATLFGVWWFALAVTQLNGVLLRVLAYFDALSLPLFTTSSYAGLLVLCIALWSLVYYLFYLLTGSRKVLGAITAYYVVYYASLLYAVTLMEPAGVATTEWTLRLTYAQTLEPEPTAALILGLILPPLIGAIGYARLFFKVKDATQRYRIGLVSATIGGWFGLTLVAWIVDLSAQPWWQFVSRSIGLLAALLIYAAYRPPGWLRRRYGIVPVDEPATG